MFHPHQSVSTQDPMCSQNLSRLFQGMVAEAAVVVSSQQPAASGQRAPRAPRHLTPPITPPITPRYNATTLLRYYATTLLRYCAAALLRQPVTMASAAHADCTICMCPIGAAATALPCCHSFHTACIDRWLTSSNTCPICRADADGASAPRPRSRAPRSRAPRRRAPRRRAPSPAGGAAEDEDEDEDAAAAPHPRQRQRRVGVVGDSASASASAGGAPRDGDDGDDGDDGEDDLLLAQALSASIRCSWDDGDDGDDELQQLLLAQVLSASIPCNGGGGDDEEELQELQLAQALSASCAAPRSMLFFGTGQNAWGLSGVPVA